MNLSNKILLTLKYEKEFVSISDFNVIPTYFYNIINSLMAQNLVESLPDPKDARKRIYKLTEKGKKELKIRGLFL